MNRLNWIFTLSSLSVLLVTIERFSFTGKVLLQPYNFIRLHELVQISILILITVVIPVLLLREITQNFKNFSKKDFWLLMAFIIGVYFYSSGNGLHEIASFTLNTFCNVKQITGNLCHGLFINDYYTGNIYYFIGGFMMVASLLLFERERPNTNYTKKNLPFLVANALIYALAIFAYAAFDAVLVGLIYSIITTLFAIFLFTRIRKQYLKYPVITYTALTYSVGTLAAILLRFVR